MGNKIGIWPQCLSFVGVGGHQTNQSAAKDNAMSLLCRLGNLLTTRIENATLQDESLAVWSMFGLFHSGLPRSGAM